jgi:hypothetical protein
MRAVHIASWPGRLLAARDYDPSSMLFDAFAACYDFCEDSQWPSWYGAYPSCTYDYEDVQEDLYGCYIDCHCECLSS